VFVNFINTALDVKLLLGYYGNKKATDVTSWQRTLISKIYGVVVDRLVRGTRISIRFYM
jgi:hypothetical protein